MRIPRLENWFVIGLTDLVVHAQIFNSRDYDQHNGFYIYTKKVLLIKNGYLITSDQVYKLGKVDKVWCESEEGKNRLKELV